ncbi:MAG TPA: site-specific integrase [Candidatus Butyricicoccus avistercoris]|uniref:Site-specific integrase n=1 Tax=Candidatus Butyricicoccus avistercoris TaxID=2838518 RepID=A0A9D1TIH1_9FIRM|nr:site-specific integrase [Candidatus Butyricicoccus avistercoris]
MARKSSRRELGSGSIVKRSDGRWQGQYCNGRDPKTGKLRRHTIYGKTQKEVAERLRAITASIDRGTFQEPSKLTLTDYSKEYVAHYVSTLSPYTQQSYKIALDKHILPALGSIKLSKLSHRDVQAFISSLGQGGKELSPKTIRNIHGVLHGLLDAAVRDEILIKNISNHCTLPRVIQKQIKPITTSELSTFLKAIEKEPFRNIFFVDIFSGLRQAEILGLRWEDIDWQNNCIYIRCQLQQRQVKGDFSYYLAPPKEGKERRVILAESAINALKQQQNLQHRMEQIAEPVWDNEWGLVFTNDFGKPLNRRTIYKHLKRVLRSCGMGDRTFHSLRHSFATISLENGDDIKTVQTNLGHYAASFTLKTYAHVSDMMQQNSANRMEALIQSLPES